MKISVCGKGGSGKSATAALLAKGMQQKGYQALVVDSDESNPGLYRMLGFDRAPVPIMELVGGKKSLKQKLSQPEILAQAEIWLKDIPPEYMVKKNGISLVAIGKIMQSLEGCACPMGVLSREFLKKLRLDKTEIAIVDMEAGVEHFGRGIDTSIDSVLIIVEPSFDSLEIAEKMKSLSIGSGVSNTWVVLNKVASKEMDSSLREELRKRNMDAIGSIYYDPEIFQASLKGHPIGKSKSAEEIGEILDRLFSEAKSKVQVRY